MKNHMVIFCLFHILLLTTSIFARCMPEEKSYKHYVERSKFPSTQKENFKSIAKLKKHLKCYPDKKVFFKLGVIYEYLGKFYLAGLAYKKAGRDDEYNRMQKLRIQKKDERKEEFLKLAKAESEKLYKQYKTKKAFAAAFHIVGPIAFATGLSLFIHDKAGGSNSLSAQYVLMFGGLTMISGGIVLNARADKDLMFSKAYGALYDRKMSEPGLTPSEFLAGSGNKNLLLKHLAGKYSSRGVRLALMSIPLTALTVLGFIAGNSYLNDKFATCDGMCIDEALEKIMFNFGMILTFAPALFSTIIGIRMIVSSSDWENLNDKPTLLTLDSISPMINPITKTYGISMGFSF